MKVMLLQAIKDVPLIKAGEVTQGEEAALDLELHMVAMEAVALPMQILGTGMTGARNRPNILKHITEEERQGSKDPAAQAERRRRLFLGPTRGQTIILWYQGTMEGLVVVLFG